MRNSICQGTFFLLIVSLVAIKSGLSQNCGEVSTVVANDGRIVSDIAMDSEGNVYVSQSPFGSSVLRLTPDGERETFIDGLKGAGGLEADSNGNLYVSEFHTQKIKLYNPAGELVKEWDSGMIGPTGLALDSDGNLYIADYGELGNSDKPDISGNSIGVIKKTERDTVQILIRDDRLNAPVDIEFDESGNLYTANGRESKILKYSPNGELTVLAEAKDEIRFGWLAYLDGAIYTTHFSGHTIYKTDIKGGTISAFTGTGTPGSDDGDLNTASFNHPNGISPAQNRDGLYVTETNYDKNISRLRLITLCDQKKSYQKKYDLFRRDFKKMINNMFFTHNQSK